VKKILFVLNAIKRSKEFIVLGCCTPMAAENPSLKWGGAPQNFGDDCTVDFVKKTVMLTFTSESLKFVRRRLCLSPHAARSGPG
jgi:hypothetical protein